MVKSARKCETETFGIVGQFHRFEDLAGKPVYVIIFSIQKQNKTNKQTNKNENKTKQKNPCIWGKNGQLKTDKNKPHEWNTYW